MSKTLRYASEAQPFTVKDQIADRELRKKACPPGYSDLYELHLDANLNWVEDELQKYDGCDEKSTTGVDADGQVTQPARLAILDLWLVDGITLEDQRRVLGEKMKRAAKFERN